MPFIPLAVVAVMGLVAGYTAGVKTSEIAIAAAIIIGGVITMKKAR